MLKIGDFSKICQVSIKSLRHWDSVGLLKPALTDSVTGYRYYSIEQVSEVNKIVALRTMGLGLPQIASLMSDHPSQDDIRAMLQLKRAELQQQVEEANAALVMIESRLRQIDQRRSSHYEIALKTIDPQPILGIRESVPDMVALVELLYETAPYARQKDTLNLLAIFHGEAYEVEQIDIEVGFPVQTDSPKPIPLARSRMMTLTTLPPVERMATTVHVGEWLALPEAYIELGRWIDANDYRIDGEGREIFHYIDWDNAHRNTVTELQFPVVKR